MEVVPIVPREFGFAMRSSQHRRVLVYERNGDWSRALRRFLPEEIKVIELGVDGEASVEASTRAMLWVVDAPDDHVNARMLSIQRPQSAAYGRPMWMAVTRPADSHVARELCAAGFWPIWDEFWQVPQMSRLITRFWSQVPRPDLSVEQRIWNNLPWSSDDTASISSWE